MIKSELRSLLHNKLLIVVLAAILLIPSIYSGLFLASMWDPYGELDSLPVAVVNQDKAVTYQDNKLTVGDDLAENLSGSNSMAFNVVDEKTAQNGLENGTYYMVVTIPEDFSKNAATLMDDNPKQMVLDYKTNPGRNYIAMKMSESAVKEITLNLTQEITRIYAQSMFDSLEEVGDGFGKAVDGTGDMLDGEQKLSDGGQTIEDNLKVLSDSTLVFRDGAHTLEQGIAAYTDGAQQLDAGIGTLKSGVDSLSGQAVSGSKQLADGAGTLNSGIAAYTAGVSSVKSGADRLNANSGTLNDGMSRVSSGAAELQDGSEQLNGGLKKLQSAVNDGLTGEKTGQIEYAAGKLHELQSGIDTLNDRVSGMDVSGLTGAMSSVGGNVSAAGNGIAAVLNSEAGAALPEEQRAQLADALSQIQSAGSTLKTVSGSQGALGQVDELKSSTAQLKSAADSLLPASAEALKTMLNSSKQVQTALNDQLVPGMSSLNSGIRTLQNGINGENGLKDGVSAYTSGVSALNSGLNQLNGNTQALKDGAKSLSSGTAELADGLNSGINRLSDGVGQLSKGSSRLVSNTAPLKRGAEQLSGGAGKIADGASRLHGGSQSLVRGITQLQDGTEELNQALADGEKEVRSNKATDRTLDMFSAPVETEETKITTVENNGHAMAAYMMSVGLWVGCLAFCLMYPTAKYHGTLRSGTAWWASKAVILYPLAVLMACVLMLVLHICNGFSPQSMGRTMLAGIAAAVCFMSIMYFFNLALGKVGSFLMLVFMVLQLAGSAGTYPLEISGTLPAKIHAYVPFTYTVDAFRSAISGGPSIAPQLTVLLVLAVVFTVLTVVLFCFRTRRIKAHKPCLYDWIESKGLA